jgi:GSH-dependent disulfide-bond oxidoreductase
VNRLYGVMNRRLADREFLAGDYSIADMACIGWVKPYKNQGQDLEDFPISSAGSRPDGAAGGNQGLAVGEEYRKNLADDEEAQKVLFGQRARA